MLLLPIPSLHDSRGGQGMEQKEGVGLGSTSPNDRSSAVASPGWQCHGWLTNARCWYARATATILRSTTTTILRSTTTVTIRSDKLNSV